MARPIKETPILYGEDARRFEERMNEKRYEDPEKKETQALYYLQNFLYNRLHQVLEQPLCT